MFSLQEPALASQAEDHALAFRIKSAASLSDALEARNALVQKYLYLSDVVVRRLISPTHHPLADDARQEACCALLEFASRFDPARGVPFPKAAYTWMKFRVIGYLRLHGAPVQAERLAVALPRLRRVLRSTGVPLGDWTDSELARATGLHVSTVRNARPWLGEQIRLGAVHDSEIHETFESVVEGPVDSDHDKEAHAQLAQLMSALDPRDRALLERVFGLSGSEAEPMSTAVQGLGFSRQRGSVRLTRALQQLRQSWRD